MPPRRYFKLPAPGGLANRPWLQIFATSSVQRARLPRERDKLQENVVSPPSLQEAHISSNSPGQICNDICLIEVFHSWLVVARRVQMQQTKMMRFNAFGESKSPPNPPSYRSQQSVRPVPSKDRGTLSYRERR